MGKIVISILFFVILFSINSFALNPNQPELKVPLAGGLSWHINNPAGGGGYHQGAGYFSIDFDDNFLEDNLNDDLGDGKVYVLAAQDGIVTRVRNSNCYQGGYDCRVEIDHGDGYQIDYLHFTIGSIVVYEGQQVYQGQILGRLGNTGDSDGPHLHFQVRHDGDSSENNPYLVGLELDGRLFVDYEINHYYPSTNTFALRERENSKLTLLNPLNNQNSGTTVLTKLGERSGYAYNWQDSLVNYDADGIPDNATLLNYVNNGAIVSYPDSNMAIEIDGNSLSVWSTNQAIEPGVEVDNSCNSFFASGYGPESGFGLPITGVYYVDKDLFWRQDFQKGYLYRNMTNNTIYCFKYPNSNIKGNPGWVAPVGWDSLNSPRIIKVYERNGASETLGEAYDDSDDDINTAAAIIENALMIQHYKDGQFGKSAIIVSPYLLDDPDANYGASVVRSGFWSHYKSRKGSTFFGAPLGDEMDENLVLGKLVGYDSSCDSNHDQTVDLNERKSCVTNHCDDSVYTSMQRFECVTLCRKPGLDSIKEIHPIQCPIHVQPREARLEDPDLDDLFNNDEDIQGTDRENPDTDNDDLFDGAEYEYFETDPLHTDTDRDGRRDGDEVQDGTDPLDSDTDNDGVGDGGDVCDDTRPIDANDVHVNHGCILSQVDDDRDGLTNYHETYVFHTSPSDVDSDDDTVNDFDEIKLNLNPLNPDTDGDGITDDYEYHRDAPNLPFMGKYLGREIPDTAGSAVAINNETFIHNASFSRDHLGYLGFEGGGAAYIFRWSQDILWNEDAFLVYPGLIEREFGRDVAISDDVAVVSAPSVTVGHTHYEEFVNVYRYDPVNFSWNLEQTLRSDLPNENMNFGYEVDIDGDTIAIIANTYSDHYQYPNREDMNFGALYVFGYDINLSEWRLETKITGTDTDRDYVPEISFTEGALSLSGDFIFVGQAHYGVGNDFQEGRVLVYQFDGSTWQAKPDLRASDRSEHDLFGLSVDIDLNVNFAVVGAIGDGYDTGVASGSAYIFERQPDNSWLEIQKIGASDALTGNEFGYSVGIDNHLIVVGSDKSDDLGPVSGSAYIFQNDGNGWEEIEKIIPDDGGSGHRFGKAVAVHNGFVAIGAPGSSFTEPGVYLYWYPDPDNDDDGLSNEDEDFYGTDPNNSDSDSDGLTDSEEVNIHNTNPLQSDTDGDGLSDFDEINTHQTDPTNPDSDNDDVDDAADQCGNSNPLSEDDVANDDGCLLSQLDSDQDDLTDYFEIVDTRTTKFRETINAEVSNFGISTVTDGNIIAIGSPFDSNYPEYEGGSVSIYRWSDLQWKFETKLTSPVLHPLSHYGYSLALEDDVLVVSAYTENNFVGAVYIYRWDGTEWNFEQKLTAHDASENPNFGRSISISEGVIAVGALFDDDRGINSGSVYIYKWNQNSWEFKQKLTAPDGISQDRFAEKLDLDQNVLAVSTSFRQERAPNSGAVYVFYNNGTQWKFHKKLVASDGEENDFFGRSVSVSGKLIAVGVPFEDEHGVDAGAVYIYYFVNNQWRQVAKLTDTQTKAGDFFGYDLDFKGDYLLIGSPGAQNVYLFKRTGTSITKIDQFKPDDLQVGDNYGASVSYHDDLVVVSASGQDYDGFLNAGAVYSFNLDFQPTDPLDSDSDNDFLSDGDEYLAYLTDPHDRDTDDDGLIDGKEVHQVGTDPLNPDTDGDGISDGVEFNQGRDPLDPQN